MRRYVAPRRDDMRCQHTYVESSELLRYASAYGCRRRHTAAPRLTRCYRVQRLQMPHMLRVVYGYATRESRQLRSCILRARCRSSARYAVFFAFATHILMIRAMFAAARQLLML